MTLETFFDKFDQFADAPDAVAKMRDLILGLAIQGKLVEQNEAEGRGRELLDQILAKRQNAKPIKSTGKQSGLGSLPTNWTETRLGIVTDIIRGVTFPGSAKSTTKAKGDVACLRTASVQAEIDWEDLIFISPSFVKRDDQWVAKNDVMISMANSYALVGKVAVVRETPEKATFGGFIAAIRPILIEPYFLLYVLRSPWMQAAFRASSSQTTNIANISLGGMRPLAFPLPPLAEQKRIVAKVDELMALCDRLEAQQQERDTRHAALARASLARFADAPTPANLHHLFHPSYPIPPADLRKSILTLAVQGKLVPQDPNDEPAEKLLKRVIVEKNRRKGSCGASDEEQDSPPHDEAFEIPLSWKWINATKPSVMVSDQGKKVQTKDILESGKYPVVDQGKMFIRGYCNEFDRVITVTEPIVLFGDHTRETKYIDFDFVVGADGVKLLQPVCIYPRFYFMVLRWLPLESRGYARHFKLLKAARIPIPPLAEQRRIVAKVDQLMVLVDELETQLAASRATAKNLLQALVAELTNQS